MTIPPYCPASPTGSAACSAPKWLQQYQLFDARYLITLDGSRYFSSCQVHCEHCLTTTHRDGTVRYHHDILQAAIVHPDKRQVLPLAPEFVRNSDANGGDYDKQDCEINAGSRMLERLRADYPRMGAIIVADSLYSKQPFVEQLTAARFSFLLVAKPGDHRSLYQDVAVLRRGNLLDRHATDHRGERREYQWVTDLPLNGNPDSPRINFIQFRIVKAGKVTYRNAWVTDLVPTTANIAQLVRAARARWKIENEGFNTLKKSGLPPGAQFRPRRPALVRGVLRAQTCWHFSCTRSSNWWMVCISGCAPCSVPAARSGTRCGPPSGCSCSPRWDQVLVRMNSPPQPLPPYQSR